MAKEFYSSLVFCILFNLYSCDNFLNPIKTVYLTNWTTNDGIVKDAKVEMPNGIYTFGEKLRLIQNVLKGSNDKDTKWIAEKYWNFTTEFSGDDLYDRKNIQLIFDGVDGVAEVRINGVHLGKMENMFRQYVYDIKQYVKNDTNKLVVSFHPPVQAAADAFSDQTREIPPKCPPESVKGDCHINMLRKMQASFGSDFGPSVPSVGFWKPVRIEAFLESTLREVITKVEDLNTTFWRLHIDCYLANNTNSRIYGRMEVLIDTHPKGIFFLDVSPNFQGEMVWSYHVDFNKTQVDTWWPIGYGSQRLYNLTINYYSTDIVEVSPKVKMIAFRKIELVQDETGNGRNFYFCVNKVPIFAKGSTLVPISIFPEDIDNTTILARIIKDAVDSNMNMLRVWGGGTYLSDTFYDLADKAGILIWQDFMFTSALYPSDENFLNNVLEEVSYQLKRIYSHPSLALFSANFEIERAFASDWYNISNRREYANDYRKLFVKTIKKEFDRLTNNSKNFVFSSPSNGMRTENEHYLSTKPNSEFYGDFHYMDQNKNPLNVSNYPIPRFVSAFGVQSLPSAESLLKQAESKEQSNLHANNHFLTHRQHMSSNFDQMRQHIEFFLDIPPENAIGVDKTFIFYSQIVQALSLKLQIEHYRKCRSYLLADGRGNTMGALYWQMNDVWSAPSLSGIDYYGRWKMTQYIIKDAFSPVIITGTVTDNTLDVFVISDLTKNVFVATGKLLVYNWSSFEPVFQTTFHVAVLALSSHQIYSTEVEELFGELNCTIEDCFFYLQLEKSGDALAPDNYVFPDNSRGANIEKHTINVTSITQLPYENIFEIEITSKYVSTFVWLDSHDLDGKFSDNGFLMVEPQQTVYFFPDKEVTLEEVKNSIDVIHSHDPVIVPSGSFSFHNNVQYSIFYVVFIQLTYILL